jgi:hypothetical protein
MSNRQTTTIGIIAILGLVASWNIVSVAYGQEFEDSDNIDVMTTFVNGNVNGLVAEMQKFGFDADAELVPSTMKMTISGYDIEPTLNDQVVANISAQYGFELIDYTIHSQGGYIVVQQFGKVVQ